MICQAIVARALMPPLQKKVRNGLYSCPFLKKRVFLLMLFLGLILKLSAQITMLKKDSVDNKSCICYQSWERIKGSNFNFPHKFTTWKAFTQFMNWNLTDTSIFFKDFYIYDFWSDPTLKNKGEGLYSFILTGQKPIKFQHQDKTITLNLTPCNPGNQYFEFLVVFSYKDDMNKLWKYDPGYPWETFDHTPESWFDALSLIGQTGAEEVFTNVLGEMSFTEDEEYLELKRYLTSLDKRFKTKFRLMKFDGDTRSDTIISELNKRNVNIENLVLKDFVLTSDTNLKINDIEKINLERIFAFRLGNSFTIDAFEDAKITAWFYNSHLGIELSPGMIRNWDTLANHPMVDLAGQAVPLVILADIKLLTYSSKNGFETPRMKIRHTPAEISGTGILIHFDSVEILNSYQFTGKYNPGEYRISFSSGIKIPKAMLIFPYKNKKVAMKGYGILLNNRMITGELEIELDTSDTNNMDTVLIKTNNSFIASTLEEFDQYLDSLKLNHTKPERKITTIVEKTRNTESQEVQYKYRKKEVLKFSFIKSY